MLEKHTHDDLLKLKNQIIDSTLVAGVVVGVLAFLVSYFPYGAAQRHEVFYSDLVVVSILVLIVINRRNIGLSIKGLIVVLCLWLLIMSDTLLYGAYSFNKVLIVIIPFYSLFIFNVRKAILLYVFFLLSYLSIGLFDWYDATNAEFLVLRHERFRNWLESAAMLTVAAVAIVVFAKKYNSALTSLVDHLAKRNKDLEESQSELELKNEKLQINNKQLTEYAFLNSHVLRAPLTRILGIAQVIDNKDSSEEQKKLIEHLKASAEELDQVVTNINSTLTDNPAEED
ncbi:MAG: histidine kinase dimerization/phospho-acceptor domain-containing protein [Reichenbachiella sp.]|uniref:histidine kinase dimerization/phospho-acceptor domain-containing protein n=1 Tax=Reichenbachiella sp. TaxID=2184521 RepID=UPI00329A682A